MLELKFPTLSKYIISYEYNQPFEIVYEAANIKLTVIFFDANHIIGSSMILFIGHFGTILYSGDLWFGDAVIKNNPLLFNPQG